MKQFLLVGIAVLFVSANASENPFDLNENFGKIDSAQEVLLSELKKIAEAKEAREEAEDATETADPEAEEEAKEDTATDSSPDAIAEETPVSDTAEPDAGPVAEEVSAPSVEDKSTETIVPSMGEKTLESTESERLTQMRNKAMAEAKKQAEDNNATIQAQKIEEERIEKEKILNQINAKKAELEKAKAEQERLAKEQREIEKREVEAYEKRRAEKLAQETKEAADLALKAASEKTSKIEKNVPEKLEVVVEPIKEEGLQPTGDAPLDINIEAEAEEAKVNADKLYKEAVEEMSKED